jgi:hypothetical protein
MDCASGAGGALAPSTERCQSIEILVNTLHLIGSAAEKERMIDERALSCARAA